MTNNRWIEVIPESTVKDYMTNNYLKLHGYSMRRKALYDLRARNMAELVRRFRDAL